MDGRKVIIAVTGSIAAYKAVHLTRLFSKVGCEVQVLMTEAAKEFVSPLTFSTLSKRPVYTRVTTEDEWNNHVELGLWADVMIFAPATANSIAKCVHGTSDNIAVATYLSARCPVLFAPAMDLDMWHHTSTQDNLKKLQQRGDQIIPVGTGELASGLYGQGRMAEPEDIYDYVDEFFKKRHQFSGKTALITAGPTHERIDPVRFIGNRSTGTMGIAIADEMIRRGAHVQLVLGPTHLRPLPGCEMHAVESAADMYEATARLFPSCDIAIFAAAVADFTPERVAEEKIKKEQSLPKIDLRPTKDIALEMARQKRDHQISIGFALETNDAMQNARNKLAQKKFDFIVLNSLADQGAGFGTKTNKVSFIFPNNSCKEFELKSKSLVAQDITNEIFELVSV